MAKPRRIIALNLGSQTIGLAEFRTQPDGGLVLHAYQSRETLIDPANPKLDEAELASLRELVAELHTEGHEVNYAIAPQSAFVRFVKLPAIEEEKIQRIVAFEAQQNVPFPLDEVVWDYQLVGGGGNEENQVVLVAIKADLLDAINRAVEETGLRTGVVDVATMALYNAFRYNYRDLDGCSLLIDIGARTSNLLFIESDKIFSRSIPIGGSSVTAALSKEFSEPFAAADFRKKDVFFDLARDADPPDSQMGHVSKLLRSTMTRLHAEVMRSISHHCAQQKGSAPARLFLCGGTASAQYVRDFFREKLHVPVELFNPLRNLQIAPSVPVEELAHSSHLLGELVGLALRSVNGCPMSLNLRPAVVVRRQELEKRLPFFVMTAAAILLSLLAWGFYYWHAAQALRVESEKYHEINGPMRVAEAKIEKLRQQASSLDAITTPLATAINDRFFWVQILEDLNARLPSEDIWITELVPTSGGKPVGFDDKNPADMAPVSAQVSTAKGPASRPIIDGILLRGLYLYNPKQQEVVVDYFRNLISSPFFKIDANNQARAIKSSIPNNTEWAFPYELHLDLKTPMKLP